MTKNKLKNFLILLGIFVLICGSLICDKSLDVSTKINNAFSVFFLIGIIIAFVKFIKNKKFDYSEDIEHYAEDELEKIIKEYFKNAIKNEYYLPLTLPMIMNFCKYLVVLDDEQQFNDKKFSNFFKLKNILEKKYDFVIRKDDMHLSFPLTNKVDMKLDDFIIFIADIYFQLAYNEFLNRFNYILKNSESFDSIINNLIIALYNDKINIYDNLLMMTNHITFIQNYFRKNNVTIPFADTIDNINKYIHCIYDDRNFKKIIKNSDNKINLLNNISKKYKNLKLYDEKYNIDSVYEKYIKVDNDFDD